MMSGESGENPELSRNCIGSLFIAVLSQRNEKARNQVRVPPVFLNQSLLARHELSEKLPEWKSGGTL
jgi:hypothetical protein